MLIHSIKEAFYLGPPPKDKLPKVYCSPSLTFWVFSLDYCLNVMTFVELLLFWQNSLQGSVLVGSISYGKLSFAGQGDHKNPEKLPKSNRVSYIIPPNKVILYFTLLPVLRSFSLLYSWTQKYVLIWISTKLCWCINCYMSNNHIGQLPFVVRLMKTREKILPYLPRRQFLNA